ncbi:unnamed protein product, partial [Coregonus sp. 'balchen']
IFLINLKRRFDWRDRMLSTLAVLGIDITLTEAVDGKALNTSQLQAMGIDMLPGYKDPYSGCVLTQWEIGCFLSHYNIWKQVLKQGLQHVLALEDDVRFMQWFRSRLVTIMENVDQVGLDWDLIRSAGNLVHPDYSYWILGYTLSLQGGNRLLGALPLGKMLSEDKYLPVMFNKHP